MNKFFAILGLSFMLFVNLNTARAAEYFVTLYDDVHYQDRSYTVEIVSSKATPVSDFKHVTASGQKGFNDKISSAKWNIPTGLVCYLYEDANFQGRKIPFRKTGAAFNVGFFSDRGSSFQCLTDTGPLND